MTLLEIVLLLSPLLAYGRVCVPWVAAPAGRVVRRTRLPLLARLRLHRPVVVAVLAAGGTGVGGGWVRAWVAVAAAVAIGAMLAVPVSCTLTDAGLTVGRTRFRRWTEFGGVARRRGGARLQGIAGRPSATVWLSGSRDDDEFVLLLRQMVRGSYKGEMDRTLAELRSADAAGASAVRPLERARTVGR